MNKIKDNYTILFFRPIFDLAWSYFLIFFAILIVKKGGWGYYPISLILIINRMMIFLHLTHEALHENLFKSLKINNFIGTFVCGFPIWVSLSKYKKVHLQHHSFLNKKGRDPDYHLSENYPVCLKKYFKKEFRNFFLLKTAANYLLYYTDISKINNKNPLYHNNEIYKIIIFWITILFVIGYYHFLPELFFFYLLPWLCFQQSLNLIAALQHAPLKEHDNATLHGRNIKGNFFILKIFFPASINLHGTHHYNTKVPYYYLKKNTKMIKEEIWEESIWSSVRSLFRKSII